MTTQTEVPTEVTASPDPTVDRAVRLFAWSRWIHAGDGASDCEHVHVDTGKVDCTDPTHFHAWCRLPNPLMHEEIRVKALAAKARRVRQLRDPESDSGLILDEEMDQLAHGGDDAKAGVVEELVNREWYRDYTEATRELGDEEDNVGAKRYEHIAQDQQRYTELRNMDPDDRPAEEFQELERHVDDYNAKVDKAVAELQKPRREALEQRDISSLVDEIREQRVQLAGTQHFMRTYNTWEWRLCTLKCPGGGPVFGDFDAMSAAAPEVIAAVETTFNELERSQREEAQGNS